MFNLQEDLIFRSYTFFVTLKNSIPELLYKTEEKILHRFVEKIY